MHRRLHHSSSATLIRLDEIYPSSWAVVIGIDDYAPEDLGRLEAAVHDANAVAEALEERGFTAFRLLDKEATRDRITAHLPDELPEKLGPDDRVELWDQLETLAKRAEGAGDYGLRATRPARVPDGQSLRKSVPPGEKRPSPDDPGAQLRRASTAGAP